MNRLAGKALGAIARVTKRAIAAAGAQAAADVGAVAGDVEKTARRARRRLEELLAGDDDRKDP